MNADLFGVPGLTFGGVGNWAIFAAVVVAIVRIIPEMTKLRNASDTSLRKDLMDRIDKLEKQLADERRECDREMESMRIEFRNQITGLEKTIEGLHKQLLAQSSALAIRLSPASTAASAAADRVVEQLAGDLSKGMKP